MKRYEVVLELLWEVLVIVFQILLCIWIIPKTLGFLWPFVIGFLIFFVTWPVISGVNNKIKVNRPVISVCILVLFLILIGGIFYLMFAFLGEQLMKLLSDMPALYQLFLETTKDVPELLAGIPWIPESILTNLDSLMTAVKEGISTVVNELGGVGVSYAGSVAKYVTNFFIGFIVSIMSAYFFIQYRERIESGYSSLMPGNVQDRIGKIAVHIKDAVGGYIIAQLKIMGIIFMILTVGLLLAGNPYAVILALLISFLDVIPFFGTGFVLMPWALYDFLAGNYSLAVLRVILYVICLLARQLLQPKMIGDSVGLDPFFTLLLIYVGFKVNGILGFLIAMIAGIILLNFYKIGLFDQKRNRIRHLISQYHQTNKTL